MGVDRKDIEKKVGKLVPMLEKIVSQTLQEKCSTAIVMSGLFSSAEILVFKEKQKGNYDLHEVDEGIVKRLLVFMKSSECPFCIGDNEGKKEAAGKILEEMNSQDDIFSRDSPVAIKAWELTEKALNQYIKSYI